MGFTTIIELNHDYAGEIEREPEKFAREILDHLNSGNEVYESDGCRIGGGAIISTFHRSNNDFDNLWTDYKRKLRDFLKYLSDKSTEMKDKGFK